MMQLYSFSFQTGVLAVVVLGACLLALTGERRRSGLVRFFLGVTCLAALSLALWHSGHGPLLTPIKGGPGVSQWVRAMAAAWWLFASRVAVTLARTMLGHDRRSRETRLFSDLLAAAIYVASTLIVLDAVLKLPIGGLVATSGIMAIVLGLALQNTLADVFAGIAVGVEQPFRTGDRVRLADGIEGRVEQMNWRSVRVRTDQDDLAIIPNSFIAKAQVTNRSSPDRSVLVRVELRLPADADPDRVLEHLRVAAMLTPDALEHPTPTPTLLHLGERSNTYAMQIKIPDLDLASKARSDLLRHARRQFRTGGLTFSAPPQCGGRLIREAILFESLTEAQLDELEAGLHQRLLCPGEVVFRQGISEPFLHLIASGVLEVTRETDSRTETLGRIGAGEYIGEIGLLTGAPRLVTATALTESRVYTLHRSTLEPLLTGSDELAHAFERSIRRGRARLARSPAIVEVEELTTTGEFLLRVRRLFMRAGAG